MITFEAPCCDQPITVESPVPDAIRCDECSVTWLVTDPEPAARTEPALAA
jgi:hypothetical protein